LLAVGIGFAWVRHDKAGAELIAQIVGGAFLVGVVGWAIRDAYRSYKARGDEAQRKKPGKDGSQ
jgi:hypothetical protein